MSIDYKKYTGIFDHSKQVTPGGVFFAIPGTIHDGTTFVNEAVKNGAELIISENSIANCPATVHLVKNVRAELSYAAHDFYLGNSAYNLAAVTGTNGKTSITHFYQQLLNAYLIPATALGTIGITTNSNIKTEDLAYRNTTIDPISLASLMQTMQSRGVSHYCIEASSHGLDQYRLDGFRIKAAAFSNLTIEHMDYHVTESAYFAAKERLFSELLDKDGIAVLNKDSPYFAPIEQTCKNKRIKIVSYAKENADINISRGPGNNIIISSFGTNYNVPFNLYGDFQLYNIAAALGLYLGINSDIAKAIEYIPNIKAACGRMELVAQDEQNRKVFIDYAHTADAIEQALKSLRTIAHNKLFIVFGCGGDRCSKKRPLMGLVAAQNADVVVITDDNPRTEDPNLIRNMVLEGARKASNNCKVIECADREKAIQTAVSLMNDSDILLITGKGHENHHIVGTTKVFFSDREVASKALYNK